MPSGIKGSKPKPPVVKPTELLTPYPGEAELVKKTATQLDALEDDLLAYIDRVDGYTRGDEPDEIIKAWKEKIQARKDLVSVYNTRRERKI